MKEEKRRKSLISKICCKTTLSKEEKKYLKGEKGEIWRVSRLKPRSGPH